MLQKYNLSNFINQSIRCLNVMGQSYAFFRTNELWKGIFRHKWVFLLTVVLSVLFTFFLFSDLYDYAFSAGEVIDSLPEDGEDNNSNIVENNKGTAIFGGSKFLVLILLEVVIFHFSIKTLEVLNNEEYKTTFRMFLKAEWRMIKILFRGAILSFITQIIFNIILSFFGFKFILPFLMFFVHSYFIGYSFFDNYNEQQKLNIKESDLCIKNNSGAATTLGVVASIGLMIPLIGVLVVPVLGAISANLYGYRYNIENLDLHHPNNKKENVSSKV